MGNVAISLKLVYSERIQHLAFYYVFEKENCNEQMTLAVLT
jgi:hypothetical protein